VIAMIEFFGFIAWLLLSFAAAMFAEDYRRTPVGWFVIAFLFSPVVAFVLLLVLGRKRSYDPRWRNLRFPEATPQQMAAAVAVRQGDANLRTMLMVGGGIAAIFLALKFFAGL
jgi:hypothetical protein